MNKKKIFFFSLLISTVSTVVVTPFIYNQSIISNSIKIGNPNLHASNGGMTFEETKANASWKYSKEDDAKKELDWYGDFTPNKVTSDQIKELIELDLPTADVKIQLLPVENDHLTNGYVQFKVIQTIHSFSNGLPDGSKEVELEETSSTTSPFIRKAQTTTDKKIWSTKDKFPGLFISSKFNFEWRDSEDIAEFIKNTKLTYDNIEVRDVLLNMVKQGEKNKLPPMEKAKLTKEKVTDNENNDKKYGTVKLELKFDQTQDTDWVGDNKPDTTLTTKVVRGLRSTDSSSTEPTSMELELKFPYEIASYEIDKDSDGNIFSKYLEGDENKLSDLFPSEIASLANGNELNELISVLVNGKHLKDKNNKAIQLKYYGKNFDDPDFQTTTGLSAEEVSKIGINNIDAVAQDDVGGLILSYNYSYYDVYTSSIKTDVKTQTFPEGTFKVNPDYQKVLEFDWKDDSELFGVSSSYDLVNEFEKNKDNPEYLQALSNQFFDGSNDAYKQPRNVEINYSSGSRRASSDEGILPIASNDTNVDVTLIFDTWNGAVYEEGGKNVEGFKTKKTFNLKNYQSSIGNLTWKTMDEVKASLPGIENLNVNEISNKLFTKEIDIATFFQLNDDLSKYSVLINTNPSIGSISISIQNGDNIESRIFTGFKVSEEKINQFNWIPESDIDNELLVIDLDIKTPEHQLFIKNMVIEKYLSKIDTFKSLEITPDDVEIEVITEENKGHKTNSLLLTVNIDKFNQNISNDNRVFKIKLRGFIKTKLVDGNSYIAKKNFTVLFSVLFSIGISAILISVLVFIIVRQVRLNVSIKNKRKTNK